MPALTLLFDLPVQVAVGTSLVGVISTSAGVAAVAPRGRGGDVGLALRIAMATAAGAIAGGLLAGRVGARFLSIFFAAVVFLTAGYMLERSLRGPRRRAGPESLFGQDYRPRRWSIGLTTATLAGMISGLLGVGGGFINVPVMYAVMEIPLGIATATSNFVVGITAAASAFVYYGRGDIHPLVVIPTAAGVFVGAMIGVYLLPRLRVAWLRLALIALLAFMGVQMLLKGLAS